MAVENERFNKETQEKEQERLKIEKELTATVDKHKDETSEVTFGLLS